MKRASLWISAIAIVLLVATLSVLTRIKSVSDLLDLTAALAPLACPFLISFRILARAELSEVRVAMALFNVGFSVALGIVYYQWFVPFADAQAGLLYLMVIPAGFVAMLFLRVFASIVAEFRGNVR